VLSLLVFAVLLLLLFCGWPHNQSDIQDVDRCVKCGLVYTWI